MGRLQLARQENVLVFGPPGSGKTHLLCAVGHELIALGHSVLFAPCVLLVQRLLLAKTELWLEKELKRLDKFEELIIDDLGYVQQSREEMEVLFTLLAHRYERRSVLLTSNLVFSEWERTAFQKFNMEYKILHPLKEGLTAFLK